MTKLPLLALTVALASAVWTGFAAYDQHASLVRAAEVYAKLAQQHVVCIRNRCHFEY